MDEGQMGRGQMSVGSRWKVSGVKMEGLVCQLASEIGRWAHVNVKLHFFYESELPSLYVITQPEVNTKIADGRLNNRLSTSSTSCNSDSDILNGNFFKCILPKVLNAWPGHTLECQPDLVACQQTSTCEGVSLITAKNRKVPQSTELPQSTTNIMWKRLPWGIYNRNKMLRSNFQL